MNTVRLNGEISTEIRIKENKKKNCPQVDFLLDAPFSHPFVKQAPNYRARLRTVVMGEQAEWIYDNLDVGSHLEIRKGFIQSWYNIKSRTEFYRIVGHNIDQVGTGQVGDDIEPWNLGRFSGFFRKQFSSSETGGVPRVGIEIEATPDMMWYGTEYKSKLSVILYGDMAEKVDGKLRKDQPIDLLEGVLQPWKAPSVAGWRLYIVANRIEV